MNKNILYFLALAFCTISFVSCDDDDSNDGGPGITQNDDMYMLVDRAARPAIAATFVTNADRDDWNESNPSEQASVYGPRFLNQLTNVLNPGYTTNALGWDAETFTGALATDVLTVATSGPTTYFDGTNVLTGRNLSDDVITTSLTLVFGGPDGTENPAVSDDNVSENDKPFLTNFPYMAAPH